MKKIYLFMLSVLIACSVNYKVKPAPEVPTVPDTATKDGTVTQPVDFNPDLGFVHVEKFVGHTPDEKIKDIAAVAKVNEVINQKCFEDKFLARKLIQTNGKTNQEILDQIRSTSVTVTLEMYRKTFSKVLGYTDYEVGVIHENRKFHDYFGPCSVGSNIFHETTHLIGYSHDYYATVQRPYSVPYSVNYAFEACCQD